MHCKLCKSNAKELWLNIFSTIMGCWPQATWFLWFRKVQLLTNWCISAAAAAAEKDNISSRGGGGSYKFDTKDPRWMDFLNQGLGSWYPPPPQSNCKKNQRRKNHRLFPPSSQSVAIRNWIVLHTQRTLQSSVWRKPEAFIHSSLWCSQLYILAFNCKFKVEQHILLREHQTWHLISKKVSQNNNKM